MSKLIFVLAIITNALILESCSKPVSMFELQAYIRDKKYHLLQDKQVGNIKITCVYRPKNLIVAQELFDTPSPSQQVVDSLYHSFADRAYFSLSFTQNGTEIENRYLPNQQAFTQALSYLGTTIAHDVYLVDSSSRHDSVAALSAIYPRQYGSTGRSTVLLVFDTRNLDLSQGFTLSYHDTHFELGTLRFPFSADDLTALPKLKL